MSGKRAGLIEAGSVQQSIWIRHLAIALILTVAFLATSCDEALKGSPTQAAAEQMSVTITPTALTVNSGSQTQFFAAVSNTDNPAVAWSASGGSISEAGLF